MTMPITTTITPTTELTAPQLLEIMTARVAVFVVEQDCAYQEADAADRTALHVCLRRDGRLVAYARLLPHADGHHMSLGRVLVVKSARGAGLGRQLVNTCLAALAERFPGQPVKIQAQAYLQDFYASFGFTPVSAVYLEDGIPHLDMVLADKNGDN
ncbi:GNAT family N-acetyltransferase [Lacticaseibacillus nasuensis]|uniref:ElaA protein n=1 Tax=Lacticaseibacillus nasuensis JCM 17158 TaxID=1291734 RepID=A0A0R1JFD4_9LACO|nr:GNAT family N-acetyltransferase [Lacticaseibacillus nasuensis]KRK69981.1 ElaA protein [Lacticaseibacillus nasuensis JCM 17158]